MNNKQYWAERMSALTDAEINKGAEFYAKLQRKYNMAIAQIEKEVSAWYTRYAKDNNITYADAQKMLSGKELQQFRMSLEEFIAKAKSGNLEWQKQLDDAYARVRISRLESMKMQLQNVAESVSMDVENGFRDVASAIYTDTYYRTAFETQKGIGMGYSFARVDESKVDKLISEPWAMDGKDFSDRVWANKNKLINELQTTFTRDIITGASPQKTIAELSERMNVSKVAAGRLVMTESAFFASAATKDSYNALSVDKYEIVATLDSHTSAICQAMDGKVLPLKEYQEGSTAPPFHVNCRSTTVPYFDDEFTDDEERASRDENDEGYIPISADIKYPEWKEEMGISNTPDMYERYSNVLRELAPATGAEFDEIRKNPAEWAHMKWQYRTLNMYDIPDGVSAKKVLELHGDAYYNKVNGFYVDTNGMSKTKAKKYDDLIKHGNAAVMQIADAKFFSHSRFGDGTSFADKTYHGTMATVGNPSNRMFKTYSVAGIPRDDCTEVKFLEFVASRIKPTDNDDIIILSEKHICPSCSDVVKQFKEKFPNVSLNIISGKENYRKSPMGTKTWEGLHINRERMTKK